MLIYFIYQQAQQLPLLVCWAFLLDKAMFIRLSNYIINYETLRSDILSINVSDFNVQMVTVRGGEIVYKFRTKEDALRFVDELMTKITSIKAEGIY